MNALRKAALLLSLSAPAALLGCPSEADGCQNYTDCRSGQTCDLTTHQCVTDPLFTGGGGGGVYRPGQDGGPGEPDDDVRTDYAVSWLERAPSSGGGDQLWFSELGPQGSPDRVTTFDAATGEIGDELVDLAKELPGSPCGVERIAHFAPPTTPVEETWVSCRQAPSLRVFYDGELDRAPGVEYVDGSAELMFVVPATGNNDARVLSARRGASTFTSYRLDPNDGKNDEHDVDTVDSDLAFGRIAGFFPVDPAGDDNTDFALVFDHAWPGVEPPQPALVPIERDHGQSAPWTAARRLDPLKLPAATHAVLVLSPPRADGQPVDGNVPNVMTFEPTTGFASYWNFERDDEIERVRFEGNSTFHVEAPGSQARILLARQSGYAFYTHQNTYRIWRVPTSHDGGNVRYHQLENSNWRPSGLVADGDEWVWVSYGNEPRIQRVQTNQ